MAPLKSFCLTAKKVLLFVTLAVNLAGCMPIPQEPLSASNNYEEFLFRLERKLAWGETVMEDMDGIFYSEADLVNLKKYRSKIEPIVLSYLQEGTITATLTAEYLKYSSAIPILKALLLKKRYEPYDQSTRASSDVPFRRYFPISEKYIGAIESISGQPLNEAIQLTAEERRRLQFFATHPGDDYNDDVSRTKWLLNKFPP